MVAKVDHPDLVHKSDAGGVRLGLGSGAEVAEAAAELLGLAAGASVLVQRQHRGVELLVGGVQDPEFGAMVMAGLGGVLVEVERDVQLAVAPVDADQAGAMLRRCGAPRSSAGCGAARRYTWVSLRKLSWPSET